MKNTLIESMMPNKIFSMFSKKPKPVESTAFSEFIRNASSREKKRVYSAVLKKASEKQNAIIEKSTAVAG